MSQKRTRYLFILAIIVRNLDMPRSFCTTISCACFYCTYICNWGISWGVPLLTECAKDINADLFTTVPLVSRMCPSDTYRVFKSGSNVRIDTTLIGFDQTSWQRGNRSYIFKGQGMLMKILYFPTLSLGFYKLLCSFDLKNWADKPTTHPASFLCFNTIEGGKLRKGIPILCFLVLP